MNPFEHIPSDEKAEQMAAERTRKLKAKHPLFADHIEAVTREDIQEAARKHRDRFEATLRSLQERGEGFRHQVFLLVSSEEFAVLEKRFASTPGTPEYLADFWHQELKRLGI